MADIPAYPGAPRWVKISGIVVAVLALLVVIIILAGGGRHGPGRHMSSTDAGALMQVAVAAEFYMGPAGRLDRRASTEGGR